jgi:hypothetical protein
MSTQCPANEVVLTTARLLNAINAKYMSADPASFSYAAYSLSQTTAEGATVMDGSTVLTLPDPASFTQVPPVYIDEAALDAELTKNSKLYSTEALPPTWAQTYHYSVTEEEAADATGASAAALCQYVFVLDALNFCFWPLAGYEYEHLAGSLKAALETDPHAFDADRLAELTPATLAAWLQPPAHFPLISTPSALTPDTQRDPSTGAVPIPLLSARTRLLRELGRVLRDRWGGSAATLVRAAGGSARALLRLITAELPGFRDHAQWGADQVFFYKRAQILIGDLWGAFRGRGLGTFGDMSHLSCFADYRIPQLLRDLGVLRFSPALTAKVDAQVPVDAGSEEEMAIRATTVQAVELIKKKLATQGVTIHAFQLDWLLWEAGERLMKEGKISHHHRTMTTYY